MKQVNQSSCECAQILLILGRLQWDLHRGEEQIAVLSNGYPTKKMSMVMEPRSHKDIKLFVRIHILQLFVRQLQQVRCQVSEVMRWVIQDDVLVLTLTLLLL
jgi:hypothetical protein